ncbi:MAG: HYR domain-containing protein, partial [Bacteroidales bacterium]|nr:HYR domain-containing protein [Bacteroidales bacterium]
MEITVNDNESPSITCPENIIQDIDPGVCEAFVFVPEPSIDDNCGIASVVNDYNGTSNASDTYPIGSTTIEWTVLDINGNANTCIMTITITDNEIPTIECPADIDQSTDPDVCEAFITVEIPITGDNCGVTSIINDYNNTGNASGIYPVGTTSVTWTVTDIHGNLNSCSMNITVTDDELPEIICPDDIATQSDPGVCEAFVEIDIPMASDNCGVASLINNYNNTGNASDIYPVGVTTVVWTITDQSGNINSCSMTISIIDEENPTIICPANIDQSTDPGVCEAFVTVNIPVTNDNCGVAEVVNDFNGTGNASSVYPVGTTTITWTVTDLFGNFETCSMDVTVMDTELPTIVCPADITQAADENVCEAFVTVDAAVISDNCGIANIVNDYNGTENASDTYPVGSTTVTWTATDIYGNINSCAMIITIEDDQNPTIECPEDIAVSTDPASCEANIEVPSTVTS